MIFVTLGSQKFQFNRLLKEIDRLVEDGKITEDVFAQIGYSDYKPKNYEYKEFLDREEFRKIMSECDKVITHGGTGAIINAVKNSKKVIAISRLAKFGEHVDNHQTQIVSQFREMKLILGIDKVEELVKAIAELRETKLTNYISNTENIISSLEEYIANI